MRFYKTVAGLFMIVLLCFAMAFYFSCMSSCQLMPEPLPIDYIWIDPDDPVVIPPDTTLVDTTQPVIIDTCDLFIPQDTPQFISFFINLDLPLTDTVFYFGSGVLNHLTYFDTIYYSGQNIAGIKEGTNTSPGNNKIYLRQGASKHFLAFHSQGLNFRGALTFDQYWTELIQRPSVQLIRFSNTGYTCDQITQALEFLIEDCKETPAVVDLRTISIGACIIEQTIIDELELRGSDVWQ